jgi:hypothetical protein
MNEPVMDCIGEWFKSIWKPPDPIKPRPIEVKASVKRKLLILGLIAAMTNTSALPNNDLSQEK